MAIDLSTLDPPVAGFGKCGPCAYLDFSRGIGRIDICVACASVSMDALADSRCDVCCHALGADGECQNPICGWLDRKFSRIYAISLLNGPLERLIKRYKYNGERGWAAIFARVLVGFLSARESEFSRFDYIIQSPTFVGAGGRSFDHTARVLEIAALESHEAWPFKTDLLLKTKATDSQARVGWLKRREIAETQLRDALALPKPALVEGKRILVYDDVFTAGFTMREIARMLRGAGATEVAGVVLARKQRRLS